MIWRPVFKQLATLQEVETHWSLDDLLEAHELLNIVEDEEQRALKSQEYHGAP